MKKRGLWFLFLVTWVSIGIGAVAFSDYYEMTKKDNEAMRIIIQHRIERTTPGVYGTYGYTCLTGTSSNPEMCDVLKELDQMQDSL